MNDLFGAGWLTTMLRAQEAAMLSAMQSVQSGIAQAEASQRRACAEFEYQRRQYNALIEARAQSTTTVGRE